MRRILMVLIVIVVLGIAANDGWRVVTAQRTLRETTYELTRWAAENAAVTPRDAAARELVNKAAPHEVRVHQYDQTDTYVEVWTEIDVTGTVVVATVANMALGKSYSEASIAPLVLRDHHRARFQ